MPPVGFKPTIPASARPQTYALDGAASGIGNNRGNKRNVKNRIIGNSYYHSNIRKVVFVSDVE
jgi:hypothetical protein